MYITGVMELQCTFIFILVPGRTQDSDSVDIQSLHVSRNKVVTLQCCTMSSGTMTFTIDGLYPHELPTSLKTDLMQFNDGQCHHVSFPANHINGSTEVLFIETADNLSTARCKYTVFILGLYHAPLFCSANYNIRLEFVQQCFFVP